VTRGIDKFETIFVESYNVKILYRHKYIFIFNIFGIILIKCAHEFMMFGKLYVG
jgi:hypothetical protein